MTAAVGQTPLDPELLARLSRLGVTIGPAATGEPAARAVSPPPGRGAESTAVLPLEQAVPGRHVTNAHGACYVSVAHRAAHETHAGRALADALTASTGSLAALARDAAVADLDLSRAAFLDTETTGLMGGTGTYAFLIGVGRFVDGVFQVRQYFMADPAAERAQLAEVAAWLSDASGLVTFNGRTFDVPLLGTRYALQRLAPPLAGAPHLDLLPAARRLWRRRLPSCALTSLEQHLLGLERTDDVPGWLIPARYCRYQLDGDARPLVGIFQHNLTDVLTMVSLISLVARTYGEPEVAVHHGRDWLSLAQQYLAAGQLGRAMAAGDTALAHGLPPHEAEEALAMLATAARRAGDWERALAAWGDLAASPQVSRLFPFEELAKYHEHRAKDAARALAIVDHAWALVTSGALRPRRGRRRALSDLEHRRARLRRRAGAPDPAQPAGTSQTVSEQRDGPGW